VVLRPPLCPELKLWGITEGCALWSADEARLESLSLPPPYWAFCWPGGQALARYVLDHPAFCAGKTILDFGAGGGIEALAALKVGAREVVASDIDPFAVEALLLNARLNRLRLKATVENLIGEDRGWEVVLAGDVFYERELALEVLGWLRKLAGRGARVLLGDPHRGYLPPDALRSIQAYMAPSDIDVGGRYLKPTAIFEVLP
jgi:predicted nicotinamide N-methyase